MLLDELILEDELEEYEETEEAEERDNIIEELEELLIPPTLKLLKED